MSGGVLSGGVLSFVLAAVGMALRDAFGTFLTVAEARGRANLAGVCDALGDGASILTITYGAGEVVVHGWTAHTVGIVATIMLVSFVGTRLWTRLSRRITPVSSDGHGGEQIKGGRCPAAAE